MSARTVVDFWYGSSAEDDAWKAAQELARVLVDKGLTERYGVCTEPTKYSVSRKRAHAFPVNGWALVLVDREPGRPPHPTLAKLAAAHG